jgi:molybdate transport system ATP-binding protein
MDEPLAALDAARKAEILPYLERLHRAMALPIVYVTHALDEVARLADHLVLLQAGRVLAEGGVADLFARTDLPLGRQDEAGVVLEARVAAHDLPYGLTRIAVPGGGLWLGAIEQPVGTPVRVRVLARDVSIAREAPRHSSVLNVLPVTLERLETEGRTVLLRLRLGDSADPTASTTLLARITRRSADTLALQPGDPLHAQIKGVALMG